jgi:uridine phosphorylase
MLDHGAHKGIMASAAGFYAPQGRKIRLGLAFPGMLSRIAVFESTGLRVLNFEMETATIYGLARLLGHRAASICVILANRIEGTYTRNSRKDIDKLIEYTLEWITK